MITWRAYSYTRSIVSCVLILLFVVFFFFFFKQKTAYEMRISDWSSDVCSSDLGPARPPAPQPNDSPRSEEDSCEHPRRRTRRLADAQRRCELGPDRHRNGLLRRDRTNPRRRIRTTYRRSSPRGARHSLLIRRHLRGTMSDMQGPRVKRLWETIRSRMA